MATKQAFYHKQLKSLLKYFNFEKPSQNSLDALQELEHLVLRYFRTEGNEQNLVLNYQVRNGRTPQADLHGPGTTE